MSKDPYSLTTPCKDCPFRTDVPPYLNKARVREIEQSLDRGEFPCHKRTCHDDDGEVIPSSDTPHCAGALILMEKEGRTSQMMRIAERLGMYDCEALKWMLRCSSASATWRTTMRITPPPPPTAEAIAMSKHPHDELDAKGISALEADLQDMRHRLHDDRKAFDPQCIVCVRDRIRELESLVSRLPHVWTRREGEWVRVAVVPGDEVYGDAGNGVIKCREMIGQNAMFVENGFRGIIPLADCYLTRADALHALHALHAQHDPPSQTEGSDQR